MLVEECGMVPHVHCRIGSSEKDAKIAKIEADVHCRIGSSEMSGNLVLYRVNVHCRIGSSETQAQGA